MKVITLPNNLTFNYYTPKELKEHLDKFVIGQDDAKRAVSIAMYNHQKRILMKKLNLNKTIDKSNILMAGPTGCGKTYMIKCLAKFMNFPYYIADCNTFTAAGYVGDDITSALTGLLKASNYSVSMAETGIVILDEVDKIAKKGTGLSITRDVSGECVQQSFLKMVEGDLIGVPPQGGRKHPEQQLIYVNTTDILFVAMGAFVDLENMIKSRMNIHRVGYMKDDDINVNADDFNPYEYMTQEDLIKFGMIPEFVGRFPIITNVNNLQKEDMLRILTEPENSIITQYTEMFEFDNIHITFDDAALESIADAALKLKTGARGLRAISDAVLNDFIYDLTDGEEKTLVITKEDVDEKIQHRYGNLIND